MNPFRYARAESVDAALLSLRGNSNARLIGGGTNLVDLMREGVEQPVQLIDIRRLPLSGIELLTNGSLRIGAAATNTEIANHHLVRERYPILSKAILSGASPQIRNMATAGGNLMQRTRCYYFMDPAFPACNKRRPGSGCGALDGANRIHAILGGSDSCIAVHPSDMCVALAALDAKVNVRGVRGERTIPIEEFHRLPGDSPHIETNLGANEMITSIDLPPPRSIERTEYLKVRDRKSFAFALVSCAAVLEMDGKTVRNARLAYGGVAPKPWRAAQAETLLVGKTLDPAVISRAADLAIGGAAPQAENKYKVGLMRSITRRALFAAGGMA